ncbi:MAG TPA: DcaP family trimeric outer membrane transporter [Stellaceae bacterium]|nr:DcaP family trimeric outer membrane transporter [Stellaceae bacterium]
MSINRKIGTIAALGSSTAALAMMTGLSGARADDLQINQQLLDTRIDQLAAVGQGAGGGGAAVFSIDQNPAASAAVTAGSFPRSILIPGTDTSIKISGQITEVFDYYLSGGGGAVNTTPQSTTIGANGTLQGISLRGTTSSTRGNGVFLQSPRESKIAFETRTPTPLGEARTVFQFDWAGSTPAAPAGGPVTISDNLVPRLQYAYGTLGGLLAGQATSNFSDPDANGETLDFGGNVGEPGHVRVPQVRWTMPAWWGSSLSFSAETPETIVGTANGIEASDAGLETGTASNAGATLTTTCPTVTSVSTATAFTCTSALLSGVTPVNIAKATAPDLTAAWYLPQPWGHVDISGVLRPGIDVTDGHFFDHQYIGGGGHIGFDIKPGWMGWVKDDITVHFTIGQNMAGFVNSSSNFDLATNYGQPSTSTVAGTYGGVNGPTTAAAAALIRFKPTDEMGAEVGYQHWWADNLRSNFNGGFESHYGIPIALVNQTNSVTGAVLASTAGQAAAINKELMNAHVNLIWNPVSFVDIGLEYTWGQRTTLGNQTATMNVLISKMNFRF